jgi:release factor glutamine methyltransferase
MAQKITALLAEAGFKAGGLENAGLEASLLLAHVLGKRREELFLIDQVDDEDAARFKELAQQRLSGICSAYLTGHKEFFGLDFAVSPAVLVPRPETETLVEEALSRIAGLPDNTAVLDLCTGSGAAAIALKHTRPSLNVFAADISVEAVAVAQKNAERLLGSADAVNFFSGDLFDALGQAEQRFDIITANAPYIPSADIANLAPEVRNEPLIALDGGKDGLDIIRRIIGCAPLWLRSGGALLLEIDPSHARTVGDLLLKAGFTGIKITKDLSGNDRVISGEMP